MKKSQIVFTNYPYHKLTLKYTLDSLARLGAEKMEFVACEPHFYVDDVVSNEVAALKALLREREIEMVCLTAPCSEYPINLASLNPVTRMRSVDYIVRHIELADAFGAPAVQFVAGEATLNEDRAEAARRAEESLAYLADIAEGYGVKLLNSYHDSKLVNVYASAREVRRAHDQIAPRAFAGMTDTVCMARSGETPGDVLSAFGDELYLVELADCKGSSSMHMAAGEGELDLDATLKEFDRLGYTGYYALNMRGVREPYLYEEEPERCMATSAEFLRNRL